MSKLWVSRISKICTSADQRNFADVACQEEGAIKVLVALMQEKELSLAQRASSVLSKVADIQPHRLQPFVTHLIKVYDAKKHVTLLRNAARLLAKLDIPEKKQGEVMEKAFNFLSDRSEPIAVRVFSMQILANQCAITPELSYEVTELITQEMPYGSSGFVARGRNILLKLNKNLP